MRDSIKVYRTEYLISIYKNWHLYNNHKDEKNSLKKDRIDDTSN